ncbi:hypothetical protein [Paractinoplanes toevensis]|uniref:hypothetical protein n=1 Tax=Paractinoplanes toevensis TaxID=571911 RepID=UPI001BB3CCC5|nr:hypothetical protein [Actinoplanes toevensis]
MHDAMIDEAQPSSGPRRRFGILSVMAEVNDAALRFLVLSLNTIQDRFEFEFIPFDSQDQMLIGLRSNSPVDREDIRNGCAAFQERQFGVFRRRAEGYLTKELPPDRIIVLSTVRFSDNFYSLRCDRISVIALGNWKRSMAPPSILEFILTLIVREVIASVSPRLSGSVHVGTKGCPCDFTPSLDEVRQKVLSSYLCQYCRGALADDGVRETIPDIEKMLAKSWIGSPDNSSSVAAITSALGHDLFLVKGLRPTFWEGFLVTLRQEGSKQMITMTASIVAGIIVAALLLLLGLKK